MEIKDSGTRREFETGAVRDIGEGKGRCDLLPLNLIGWVLDDFLFIMLDEYIRDGNLSRLQSIYMKFATENFNSVESATLEVAKHYEEGAKKYAERNWEIGIPLHCYIDSAVRHYLKYKRGDKDEPHDRAFLWNILGAWWTHVHRPEMIDLPFKYLEEEE